MNLSTKRNRLFLPGVYQPVPAQPPARALLCPPQQRCRRNTTIVEPSGRREPIRGNSAWMRHLEPHASILSCLTLRVGRASQFTEA